MEKVKAPGLKYIKRKASETPTWVASAKGFRPRTVNLAYLADRPDQLLAKCVSLNADMHLWLTGFKDANSGKFDGTIGWLIDSYQTDPDSPYFALRHGSRRPYDHYLAKLKAGIGKLRVNNVTGVDLKRWHVAWSNGGESLAASAMQRAVLDAVISFGVMCRLAGCAEVRESLKAAGRKLPHPRRREVALSADQVAALRKAAHDNGAPSRALVYALVFESTLRLWDVIGQWIPVGADGISDVMRAAGDRRLVVDKKWFGLRWSDIDDKMIVRYTPSKTSEKTGRTITYPLGLAPMVIEELAHWPPQARTGAVIKAEATGEPYFANNFGRGFALDRAAAKLPTTVWARDLRASGITEGRRFGASTDDAGKVAGHAGTRTTSEVYDRANLEAAERFAETRIKGR